MNVTGFEFLLMLLACFRFTRLIVFDKITACIRTPFHKIEEEVQEDGSIVEYLEIKGTGVRRFFGELLSCYWCVGIWSAFLLYGGYMVYPQIFEPLIMILAIAGAAAVIQAITNRITDQEEM